MSNLLVLFSLFHSIQYVLEKNIIFILIWYVMVIYKACFKIIAWILIKQKMSKFAKHGGYLKTSFTIFNTQINLKLCFKYVEKCDKSRKLSVITTVHIFRLYGNKLLLFSCDPCKRCYIRVNKLNMLLINIWFS